jgi:hypothetical protein
MPDEDLAFTAPVPTAAEQAWLDATPRGDARTITHRVGELAVDFTVDRRPVQIGTVKVDNGVGISL